MTQVYTYEIVGQLFGTNFIQSGAIVSADESPFYQPRLRQRNLSSFSEALGETRTTKRSTVAGTLQRV